MKSQPPAIFTLREIETFTAFVKNLPIPFTEIDPKAEALNSGLQCLLLLPREPNKLIDRESFPPASDIQREMIPLGGLKVYSRVKMSWPALFTELQRFDNELEDAPGGHRVLYILTCSGNVVALHFKIEIPFGMFNVAQEEIRQALERSPAV